MAECKHGLKLGCSYCHASPTAVVRQPAKTRRTRASTPRLAEQMNDRMTALKRRLRELRGEGQLAGSRQNARAGEAWFVMMTRSDGQGGVVGRPRFGQPTWSLDWA